MTTPWPPRIGETIKIIPGQHGHLDPDTGRTATLTTLSEDYVAVRFPDDGTTTILFPDQIGPI